MSGESEKQGWEGKFLKSVCYRVLGETAVVTRKYRRKSGNCPPKSQPSMAFELQMMFQNISN